MKMLLTIASREFRSLFLSPLAWTFLAVIQFLLAFLFLSQVETFTMMQAKLATIPNAPGLTDIVIPPLFGNAGIILLLATPLLTMRMICEERRNKTLSLLLSAPISNTEIILGKYLGLLGLLWLIVLLAIAMPLSLLLGGALDFGKLFANGLALGLLVTAFSAAGLYMSCLSGHPTVAAMGTFGLLLLLWVLDWSSNLQDKHSELFAYLSILRHFQGMQTGLLNSADILYFVLFSAGFIALSIRRLESDRLQQ